MEHKDSCLIGEPNALGIFKTLFLFLQNHNLPKTAETLREEWGVLENEIENLTNLSVLLTRCKSSRNQANQTAHADKSKKLNTQDWLEGTFQGETFHIKENETRVFFVCDHCQEKRCQKGKRDELEKNLETPNHKQPISPSYNPRNLKCTFTQLQDDHQKLIGQTKNIYSVLEHCKDIYPSLFDKGCNTQLLSSFDSISPDEKEYGVVNLEFSAEEDANKETNNNFIINSASQYLNASSLEMQIPQVIEENLQSLNPRSRSPERVRINSPLNRTDIEQIVTDVLKDSIKSPRNCGAGEGDLSRSVPEHRITKNDTVARNKILDLYIFNDVLDLYACVSIPERLLLAYGSDHYVKESTCRLINTLASLKQGRDYLTIDERLLKRVLIKKVKDVRTVSGAVMRNMLVATVQKLSIRKQCRVQMVKEGLFEVMVDYLDEFYDKLSKYCLEYCSALLMNLCLVDQAKERSTRLPKKIVGLLRKFLEGEVDFCLPYINGVMFSLFEKEEIVSEATNQNLDKTIMKLIQSTQSESVKKQLDFILQSRLFGKSDPNIHDDDEDKKSSHSVTFSMTKRESSNSAKTFSEETKQFLHKPSTERGIFDTVKHRRYGTTCSQNVLRNLNKRTQNQSRASRISAATPLCYMENCKRLQHGKNAECYCSKCVPGQNRYSCGCYEAIKKEIGDTNEADGYGDQNFKVIEPKNSQLKSEITETPSALGVQSNVNISQRSTATSATLHPNIDTSKSTNMRPKTDNKEGGRKKSGCKVCGEKKCECAFESRPKLCRTPTL
ncbi:unnamed protein product [Ceutorhynchus assimilis]|uniref:LisH domain-containing protein n=1 Tax=Ceutorhynchus assimilis TaxID=467358 RepID=A0A9N9MMZ0_9CUCU|nr:unnamed protein product [Ceutorhynchus assimilis]